MSAKKILIIRFSSIGDIVLTSPVVRCLKAQLQDVEIHYLTKKAFSSILEANPNIDRVFTIDKKENSLKTVVKTLKKEQYNVIVDLHSNLRSRYVRYKLGIKAMVFDKINFQKWLLVNFKRDKMPNVHIVDRYLDAVKPLRIQNDHQGLDYHIPILDYMVPQHLDARLQSGHFLVFVIGAAHATKRMPPEKIKAVCQLVPHEMIVLIGGKGDVEASKIVQEAGHHVVNTCGQLNLHQSASIVDQARVVVAHDTGFMHIAAALKRPIVSIWGNTVPKFGMYPYLPPTGPSYRIVENKALACRPCSKIGYESCPKGHFKCMEAINPQEIVNSLTSF